MGRREEKVKKRAIYVGVIFLLIILILFFVSKFVIKDFREFFGFEFKGKDSRAERSEIERALMAPGDVVAVFNASRTSCVAPCAVFFDATETSATTTSRPFHELDYSWDFGDANAGNWWLDGKSKNSETGPIAAHVYETPGIYTITLTVKDSSGNKGSRSVIITITDPDSVFFGANTTCFSSGNDFAGCPDGARQVTTDSWSAASSYIATGRRLLFKRGDTWNVSSAMRIRTAGPGMVGAFGSGPKPKFIKTGDVSLIILSYRVQPGERATDWRIMDLHVDGNNVGVKDNNAVEADGTTENILVLRLTMENVHGAFNFGGGILDYWNANGYPGHTDHKGNIFVENQLGPLINGTAGGGAFIGGVQMAFIGNSFDNYGNGEHVLRIHYLDTGIVAHNVLRRANANKHELKMHADPFDAYPGTLHYQKYTQKVVISNNAFEPDESVWTASFGTSSDNRDERVREVIVEKNYFTMGTGESVHIQVNIDDSATVRNNVLNGGSIFVTRRGEIAGASPDPNDIFIYSNSGYEGRAVNYYSFITVGASAERVSIYNNIASAPNALRKYIVRDYGVSTVQGNNLLTDSPGWAEYPPASEEDFRLQAGSPAIDNGTPVPVFDDYDGVSRPHGAGWDIGAYEYVPEGNCIQDNRSLGINLDSPVDYSTELPFVDFFKLARPWISTDVSESVWSTGVADKIPLDENGYPLQIPYDVSGYGMQILHTLLAREINGMYPVGNYTLFFDGGGRIKVGFDAETKIVNQSGTSFKVTPGNGGIHLMILESDASNHIRNIRVIMPGFENNYTTNPFNPKFIERLKEFRVVRFLNWMEHGQENNIYGNTVQGSYVVSVSGSGAGSLRIGDAIALSGASYSCSKGFVSVIENINGNSITLKDPAIATINNVIIVSYNLLNWSERVKKDYYTQASEEGVAPEYLIEMANAAGVSPWFTIPHRASDEYVRELAIFTQNNLNPELNVYLEYSNEVWNSLFKQCVYAIAKGSEIGLPGNEWYQGWYFRSRRSVEMFNIWSDVFGEQYLRKDRNGSRLIRVLGGQNAWVGQNTEVIDFKTNGYNASEYADALAIAIYFGGEITNADENLTIDELFVKVEQGIDASFNASSPRVSNFRNAKSRGLDLVGYEAGTHLWVRGATTAFDAKLDSMMRDDRIKGLYSKALNYWKNLGVVNGTGAKVASMFTLAGRYLRGHRWGHLEYIDQEPSTAPKYLGLREFMNANPAWWNDQCVGNGIYCGNLVCNGNENCSSCSLDCGSCPVLPRCDDEKQNGDETGRDCGGSCPACVVDTTSPVISLNSPVNNEEIKNNNIEFSYNVSDNSLISNCTLFIGAETRVNDTIENNAVNNFELDSLGNGEYSWNISCSDNYGNIGESETRKLIFNYQPPADGGTTGGNGGGSGISPKPVAKPINMTNESVEIASEENKIVLGEELSFIDIKDGEEVVIVDLYGNSYKISFALSKEGNVLARVLNGDYIIPRGEVLPISLGREEMFVGIVASDSEKAKIVMGLNKEKVIGEIEEEGRIEEEEIIENRISGWYVVFGVLVFVIIVGVIVWVIVGKKEKVQQESKYH